MKSDFFLRHWKMLEQNINVLNDHERKTGKLLFNSLNKLSADDRQALKEKYYDSTVYSKFDKARGIYLSVIPVKDEVAASKGNVSLEEFRENKNRAIKRLEAIMDEVSQAIKNNEQYIYMELKGYYVKGFGSESTAKFSFSHTDLVLSPSFDEAYTFNADNKAERAIVESLENCGFERRLLDRNW
ncbi:hypothetical protein [Vagococcus hydrophili]|uniref:Uncharacterized protein n=1 Tax=Vagococcus hydrophili TaxID=2714947 RepID=A0A6G8ARI6_9ENTE|nr:hypothetical protein [Vagococcus hydrophili]QIL47552.1 hypothetical protein G7082_02875 [Vagococcus hydrophili]